MADADLDLTRQWLATQGFHVTSVSRAHDRITFSGTAAQIRTAFGTPLHHYTIDNELHLAPAGDLSLPADLAAITTAVLHLSDFRPHPQTRFRPRPAFTSISTEQHYLTPKDLAVLYNTGSTFTGTGHSIAVVGQSFVNLYTPSPVLTFQALATAPHAPYSVLVPGSGVQAISPGDASESELDLEYASGLAPSANIFLVYVGSDPAYSVFDALTYAVNQNLAEVITISYGECETFLSAAELQEGTAVFEQAAAQGQTLIASSGDAGGTACAPFSTSGQFTAAHQQALVVGYPADSPLVTAVGGTQMAPPSFAAGPSPFWTLALTGDVVPSLTSYVPEIAWNEGSPDFGILAGGGGASLLFGRPDWQLQLPGLPAGNTRVLPDIALQASVESPGFLICTDDRYLLESEGQTVSCVNGLLGSNNQYTIAGGTSFAAPTFAGMVALLNQQQGSAGQGNLNPLLYQLAASTPSVFHDITTGSTACIPGAYRCGAPGQTGFAALPGFDQATGLGSLDFGLLLAALPPPPSSPLEATLVLLSTGSDTVPIGGSDLFQVSVGSVTRPQGETTPTGTVAVAVDGAITDSALLLVPKPGTENAIASYTFIGPPSPALTSSPPPTPAMPLTLLPPRPTPSLSATSSLPAPSRSRLEMSPCPPAAPPPAPFWSLPRAATTANSCGRSPSSATTARTSPPATRSRRFPSRASPPPPFRSAPAPPAPGRCRPRRRAAAHPLLPRAVAHSLSPHAAATPSSSAPWGAASAVTLSALLLCGLVPTARRRSLALLCLLPLLAVSLTTLSGCGGRSSATTTPPATPPVGSTPGAPAVTYTFALTGTDSINGAIQSSTNFTLTVQ